MVSIDSASVREETQKAGQPWRKLRKALAGVVTTLFAWRQRAKERNALASMSDRGLKDLGLSRADVIAEHDKPFWRE